MVFATMIPRKSRPVRTAWHLIRIVHRRFHAWNSLFHVADQLEEIPISGQANVQQRRPAKRTQRAQTM